MKYASNMQVFQVRIELLMILPYIACNMQNMQKNMHDMQNMQTSFPICRICTAHFADGPSCQCHAQDNPSCCAEDNQSTKIVALAEVVRRKKIPLATHKTINQARLLHQQSCPWQKQLTGRPGLESSLLLRHRRPRPGR